MEEEVVVPAAGAAFHGEGLLAGVLFQQRQREAPEPRQILGKVAMSGAQNIFTIRHVECPVAAVFDLPMTADRFGELLDAHRQTAQKVANVHLFLVSIFTA